MAKGEIKRKELVKEICKAIQGEELALFIGSGLSIPSGHKSWIEMLADAAKEINLEIDNEKHDLVSLAQYYCNSMGRTSIDNLISENFASIREPTDNHELLAQLPISTIWTTNYDELIETSLKKQRKKVRVKTKDSHLRGTNIPFDVIVYKMHGEARDPSQVVITRSDYENYGYDERKLFRDVLEGDLLTKTFLFLGFSFTDPNFRHVVARLRVLLNESGTRRHFCIMKKALSSKGGQPSYEQVKQNLQVEDLSRYDIRTCLVDEFCEITDILESIVNKYRRNTIFISGSAYDYDPLPSDEGKMLIYKLTRELTSNGYRIVNGYGLGVGAYVINGVADYCYENPGANFNDILTLMPFPLERLDDQPTKGMYSRYRELMIRNCGIAIYLFGNKGNGQVASGVMEEFSIAQKFGLCALPIRQTGGAAENIYDKMARQDLSKEKQDILALCGHQYQSVDVTVSRIMEAVNLLNKEA